MKFCENPKCPWHIDCAEGITGLQYPINPGMAVPKYGTIRRVFVRETKSQKVLALCESCANVAQLINEV